MAVDANAASAKLTEEWISGTFSGPLLRLKSAIFDRDRQHAFSVSRRRRVLNIATCTAAIVSASFGIIELMTTRLWVVALINGIAAVIFLLIPLLHRFGELLAPVTLVVTAYALMFVIGAWIGTHTGIAFFFLMSALVAVLVLGTEHMAVACGVVVMGAAVIIAVNVMEPVRTADQPEWATNIGFAISAMCASVMIVATVWYALREIQGAKEAIELEYERSEYLLSNILPTSVADRLKNPTSAIIADKYDDASVLFADIAGYTERASQITPVELVEFLNRVYSEFDLLVERHGLEKVKTTGDCYMVVSGVPQPRPGHLNALARFALDLAEAAGRLTDQSGQRVPIRIGIAAGPVVAGVVGTCRFFYDVWGDAVNVASRMESTSLAGRIQVPAEVYERLRGGFVFEERGDVVVKGKGVLRTWFLVGEQTSQASLVGRSVGDGG